jgi:hypothetical protein
MRARDRVIEFVGERGMRGASGSDIGAICHIGSWRLYPILLSLELSGRIESSFALEAARRHRIYRIKTAGTLDVSDRRCATCQFWVPTEMEVYKPHAQPHEARSIATQSEMLRATHALCSWSGSHPDAAAFFAFSPPWMKKSHAAGGTLTAEDDGVECACWTPRADIQICAPAEGIRE